MDDPIRSAVLQDRWLMQSVADEPANDEVDLGLARISLRSCTMPD